MKVTHKRFLEVITSPTKQYVRLRLNNTVKPPVVFSEHKDSFALQILENEYVYFLQDGDVVVNSPVFKESRVIVVDSIQDLIKNDNANRTILQYKKGMGIIALGEIPNIDKREMVDINTNLINQMGELLNLVSGHRLPASLVRAPQKQFKVSCFSFNKAKPNAMEYLKKVMDNPCIRESFLIDWCDTVVTDQNGTAVLNKLGRDNDIRWMPSDAHLMYRIYYHPDHGFTFLGSVTDFITSDVHGTTAQISFNFNEVSPFSLAIHINDAKKTFSGEVMIDVTKVGLPEALVNMF